jgi:type II secretory pathway component PulF
MLMENSKSVFLEKGIFQALSFLSFYCGIYLFWIFRVFKGDFSKKVMITIHFFLQQNFTMQDCLKILILSEKSEKRLAVLEEILRELKSGKEFFSIVKKNKMFSKFQLSVLEKTKWNKDYKKIFFDYYNLEKRREKKRVDNIQRYSEVVMIFGVGIFFLILLRKTILPFLTF